MIEGQSNVPQSVQYSIEPNQSQIQGERNEGIVEIDIKLYFQNEIFMKRKAISNYQQLKSIAHQMALQSGWKEEAPMLILYKDQQNESITINNQDSLDIAISDITDQQPSTFQSKSTKKRLKIFITFKKAIASNIHGSSSFMSAPTIPFQLGKRNTHDQPSFLNTQNAPVPNELDPQYPYFLFWKEFMLSQQQQQQQEQYLQPHPKKQNSQGQIYESFPAPLQQNQQQFSQQNQYENQVQQKQPLFQEQSVSIKDQAMGSKGISSIKYDAQNKQEQDNFLSIPIDFPSNIPATGQNFDIFDFQQFSDNFLSSDQTDFGDTSKKSFDKIEIASSLKAKEKGYNQDLFSLSQDHKIARSNPFQETKSHISEKIQSLSEGNNQLPTNNTVQSKKKEEAPTIKQLIQEQNYQQGNDFLLLEEIVIGESIVRQSVEEEEINKTVFQKRQKLQQIKNDDQSDECILSIILGFNEKCKSCKKGLICSFKNKYKLIQSILNSKILEILPFLRQQFTYLNDFQTQFFSQQNFQQANKTPPESTGEPIKNIEEKEEDKDELVIKNQISFHEFMDVVPSVMNSRIEDKGNNKISNYNPLDLSYFFSNFQKQVENQAINENQENSQKDMNKDTSLIAEPNVQEGNSSLNKVYGLLKQDLENNVNFPLYGSFQQNPNNVIIEQQSINIVNQGQKVQGRQKGQQPFSLSCSYQGVITQIKQNEQRLSKSMEQETWENVILVDGMDLEGEELEEEEKKKISQKNKSINQLEIKESQDLSNKYPVVLSLLKRKSEQQEKAEEKSGDDEIKKYLEADLSISSHQQKNEVNEYDAVATKPNLEIICHPQKNLDILIEVQNVGSKSWEIRIVKIRSIKGIFENLDFPLKEKVGVGQKTSLHLQIQSPKKRGEFSTEWKLFTTTKAGDKFNYFGPTFQVILIVQQNLSKEIQQKKPSYHRKEPSLNSNSSSKKEKIKLNSQLWKEIEKELFAIIFEDRASQGKVRQFLAIQKCKFTEIELSKEGNFKNDIINDFFENFLNLQAAQQPAPPQSFSNFKKSNNKI